MAHGSISCHLTSISVAKANSIQMVVIGGWKSVDLLIESFLEMGWIQGNV